jgi:hypothetical protein
MNLYQITFSNDIGYGGPAYTNKTIIVYASDPQMASEVFVDLALNPNELYQKNIRACLVSMAQWAYFNNDICIDWVLICDVGCEGWLSYRSADIQDGLDDEFLNDNRDNLKLLLQNYLEQLNAHIVIEPLRISNEPTTTKRAK